MLAGTAQATDRAIMTDAKPRVKPRLPRGYADRMPADIAATERMLDVIRATYELYGFEPVETPFVEYTEALGKFLPDQDRPNEGVFSFQDDDDSWLSLRYDLTAPLARHVAEHFDRLPKPYRSYRCGWVFRNEKPGPGRFRQFMQFDADTVGASSPAADAEICMMAADTLERLGVARGDYVIKVNSRRLLDGVMMSIGLDGDASAGRRLMVLRAIDKLDRLGPAGVRLLLGPGRKDESGDFTKGAGLDAAQIDRVLQRISTDITADGNAIGLLGVMADIGSLPAGDATETAGFEELSEILRIVRAAGFGDDRIRIDPSVVRGLEYYTGAVFEAELTFEVKGEDGKPIRFGSVGGGGRYDGLVGRFRGEDVPATGFSIGVSRLFAALKEIKSPLVTGVQKAGPVVVIRFPNDPVEPLQKLVQNLRGAGIAAELYLGSAGLNAQLKYADKRNAPVAIIQGSNEREKGEVAIRDLVLGAKLATMTKDRADYLELRQQAQFSCSADAMVTRVKEVLTRGPQ